MNTENLKLKTEKFTPLAKRESNQCSATSMVVTLHWRAHSLSVEKAADEISATGSPRRLSPIDVSHLGVNGERPGRARHKKKPPMKGGFSYVVCTGLEPVTPSM